MKAFSSSIREQILELFQSWNWSGSEWHFWILKNPLRSSANLHQSRRTRFCHTVASERLPLMPVRVPVTVTATTLLARQQKTLYPVCTASWFLLVSEVVLSVCCSSLFLDSRYPSNYSISFFSQDADEICMKLFILFLPFPPMIRIKLMDAEHSCGPYVFFVTLHFFFSWS